MEKEVKHTELPWVQNGRNGIHNKAGNCIAITHRESRKEDAVFIVTACNNHYSLLEALKEARSIISEIRVHQNLYKKINKAIKDCGEI